MATFIHPEKELPIDARYEVIAETDEFLLVNKSGNIPVHEGGRYQENSLTRVLGKDYGKVTPVFRLDRETSGLVLFAKKNEYVKRLFDNCCEKEYLAIVSGFIDAPLTIDAPIGECKGEQVTWKKCVDEHGKEAFTEVYPLRKVHDSSLGDVTFVRIIPKTGRQHQIRVHLAHINHPILHDKIYGESEEKFIRYLKGERLPRQMLHMKRIRVYDKYYEADAPADFNLGE